MNPIKLSVWAKRQGIAYGTAVRWCKEDKMPDHWERSPSGSIFVYPDYHEPKPPTELPTYTYARVSSNNKKDDLERQEKRIADFCAAKGWTLAASVKEVASGMNDNRKGLNKILSLPPGRLIVEHKDRLTRFGFNYLETLLGKLGWEIIVINAPIHDEEDILQDLVSIITSFCCRIYGKRKGGQLAASAAKALEGAES